MKRIRKISGNPVFIIMLTFSLLFASCSEEAVVPNTIENISGKELFKSIVFADGNLTANVPALQKINVTDNLSKEQLIEFRAFQNKAIEYLESTEKNYFDNFKQNIMTRDVEIISKTLSNSSKSLEPLVNILANGQKLNIQEIKSQLSDSKEKNSDLQKSDEEACLAIVIVLFVWYWYTKDIPQAQSKGSSALNSETSIINNTVSIQLVDYLTTN
jgi:hypothetical protein